MVCMNVQYEWPAEYNISINTPFVVPFSFPVVVVELDEQEREWDWD